MKHNIATISLTMAGITPIKAPIPLALKVGIRKRLKTNTSQKVLQELRAWLAMYNRLFEVETLEEDNTPVSYCAVLYRQNMCSDNDVIETIFNGLDLRQKVA